MAWKHYRMLLRVPSVEQRRFYERRADESAWSTRELKRQIDAGLYIHSRDAPEALAAGEDPSSDALSHPAAAGSIPTVYVNGPERRAASKISASTSASTYS